MTGRRAGALLAAILGLGLVVRLWVAAHLVLISADGISRISMARAFAERGFREGLTACLDRGYHPFNPWLVSLAGRALGDFERGGFAVSIAFGTLSIAGIFLLAREAFGEREGLLSALLWACLPNAVHTSADVLTEGQFLCLWLMAAWMGLSALRRGSLRRMAAAGLLAGLAYLTRVEGLGVPVALGAALLAPSLKGRFRLGAALATGFLLAASPYLLYQRAERGGWRLSPQKSVTNLVTKSSTAWTPPAPGLEPGLAERIGKYADPVRTGVRTVTPWILALALAGLWRIRPWGPGGTFLLILAAVHAAVLLRLFQTAGYASHRHFLTLAALAVAWAAAGLSGLPRRAGAALGALACAALLLQACQVLRSEKAYRREMGAWLDRHAPRTCWISSRAKPEIAYYARRADLNCETGFGQYLEDLEGWFALCAPKDLRDRPLALKGGGPRRDGEILILEREDEEDFIRKAAAHPRWESWPLPEPHGRAFAAFRRRAE